MITTATVPAPTAASSQLAGSAGRSRAHVPSDVRYMRGPDVDRYTGMRKSWRYKLIAEGKFPKPIALGPKMRAWRREDIDRWCDERECAA